MGESYGSLFKKAVVLIDQFAASKQNMDDFIEDASEDLKNMELQHREFVIVVVSGCIEQKKALDIIINSFLCHEGKTIHKHFRSQYVALCYLTLFHFDDLGPKAFNTIARSLNTDNMLNFLTFFFENLTTWIQDELNSIYDAEYVMDHWIDPLLRRHSEIATLLKKLGAGLTKTPCKPTKPVEFFFHNCKHQPRHQPALSPEPSPSPLPEKYVPVPNSTYTSPKEFQILEELKQRNHQIRDEQLYEIKMARHAYANPHKSEHAKRVMAKIKKEQDSKLKFSSTFTNKPLPINKKTWPVKLNSATILRQRALYDHRVIEELQRVENLVEGACEPYSFQQWQKAMRDKDQQEKMAILGQRHETALVHRLESAIDRAKTAERKKKAALLKKEETSQIKLKNMQKQIQEENKKRDIVQEMSENCKTNPKKARKKVKEFNQTVVKQISAHKQKLHHQAKEEEQAEHQRKCKAVSEVKTIQHFPTVRLKCFDDTKIAGHELLEEMSHAELKERLFFMKEADIIEQQKKRNGILEEKHKKQQLLWEEMNNINLKSKVMAMAAMLRKEEKMEDNRKVQKNQEEMVMALRKKLEEKKQEYEKGKKAKLSKKAEANNQEKKAQENQQQKTLLKIQCRKVGLKTTNWEDLEKNIEEYIEREESQVVSQRRPLKKKGPK
ncbi:cilia- and flagella-associated protein 99-like [Stigmatopora argus]